MNRLDPLPFALVAQAAVSLSPPPAPPVQTYRLNGIRFTAPPDAPETTLRSVMALPTPGEKIDLKEIAQALRQGAGTGLIENLLGFPVVGYNPGGTSPLLANVAKIQTAARGLGSVTMGAMRGRIQNALAVLDAWDGYPWPGVEWAMIEAFMERVGWAIHALTAGPPLSPLEARNWTTASLASEYGWIVDRYNAIQAAEVREDQRRAVVRMVGLAIFAAVVTAGVAGLGVSAGTVKTVSGQLGKKISADAGRSMRAMAAQVRENQPLFALELQRVADLFGEEVLTAGVTTSAPLEKKTAPEDPTPWARFWSWLRGLTG